MQKEDSFIRRILRFCKYHKMLIVFLVLFFTINIWAMFGDKGFISRVKLVRENNKLYEQYKEDSAKSVSLEKEIEELNKSDKKLEKIAREKFGMTKPGEKIFKILIDSTKK